MPINAIAVFMVEILLAQRKDDRMSMSGVANDFCPFCGQEIQPPNQSRDHIFVASLGGLATVPACRDCNSNIGTAVEGPLQRSNQFFNVAKAAEGAGVPIKGTLAATGEVVTYDFTTHELRSTQPVRVTTSGNVKTYHIHGSPQQVEEVLRGFPQSFNIDPTAIEGMIRSAPRTPVAGEWIQTTISHDLALSDRLTAKVALAAGQAAFASSFGVSPLARQLREILNGSSQPDGHLSSDVLEAMDEGWSQFPGMPVGFSPITPASNVPGKVIFIPMHERTSIFVFIRNVPISFCGMIVDLKCPVGDNLPVIISDAEGGVTVRVLSEELGQILSEQPQVRESGPHDRAP